jgi:nitrogen fixation protein FixH
MKLNWGTSIAIFYSLFVVVMIIMVVRASQNSVQLVQDNYYDKDLNYEAFRKSRENTANLKEQIEISHQAGTAHVTIGFPKDISGINGSITMYRPSNRFQDKKYTIKLNEENSMMIPLEGLSKGLWKILIDWKADNKSFYQEEDLIL